MITAQHIDWTNIESLVGKLSENILKLPRTFSSITTLSRGGLIPSRLLADSLGIKTILVDQKIISSDSLFVDDIFDTGKTFYDVFANVDDSSKFVFATLFARRGMKYPEQLMYAEKTFDDSYVVFPWDRLEFKNKI
jgi:hypoxanthine phosphoribosyltransferase|tara:strand:- start:547 stop:954 length:408 start_codon:yes stop_codon:yes gene_type:complete